MCGIAPAAGWQSLVLGMGDGGTEAPREPAGLAMEWWAGGRTGGEEGRWQVPGGRMRLAEGDGRKPSLQQVRSRWRPGTPGKSSEAEDFGVIKAARGERGRLWPRAVLGSKRVTSIPAGMRAGVVARLVGSQGRVRGSS